MFLLLVASWCSVVIYPVYTISSSGRHERGANSALRCANIQRLNLRVQVNVCITMCIDLACVTALVRQSEIHPHLPRSVGCGKGGAPCLVAVPHSAPAQFRHRVDPIPWVMSRPINSPDPPPDFVAGTVLETLFVESPGASSPPPSTSKGLRVSDVPFASSRSHVLRGRPASPCVGSPCWC